MQAPAANLLLDAWEQGRSQPPLQRALILLDAANLGPGMEALAALSIGQRDARLLDLREALFGAKLDCLVACPDCNERLELEFDISSLRLAEPRPAGDGEGAYFLRSEGYTVQFRLPDSRDLMWAAVEDAGEARRRLLARCILSAEYEGQAVDAARPRPELPDVVTAAVVERMAALDPQADVRLDLRCPVCGHTWEPVFDILSFLWAEIEAWARRTLNEVHLLASAYGWTEAEVLAISAWRRRYYLERASE